MFFLGGTNEVLSDAAVLGFVRLVTVELVAVSSHAFLRSCE